MTNHADRETTVIYMRISKALKTEIDKAVDRHNQRHPLESPISISDFASRALIEAVTESKKEMRK